MASTAVMAESIGPRDLVPWLLVVSGPDGAELDRVPVDDLAEGAGDGTISMTGRGARFRVEATWAPLPGTPRGWSVSLAVTPTGGPPVHASVAVAVEVPADRDPRWLVPGVFYGENRPANSRARHPRWVAEPDPHDPFASPDWWLRADRCAIPAVLASGGGVRVALATTEQSPVGQSGVGFGPSPDGARRQVRLSFPERELPVVYDGSPDPKPPDRPVHHWEPDATVRLGARVYAVPDGPGADAPILRALRAWLAGPPLRPEVDPQQAATLAADGLLRWHFRPDDGVLIETAAFDRARAAVHGGDGDRLAMHVAWLSGVPVAEALLAHGLRTGRRDAVDAGRRVLDAIATNLAPCGTFWGQWTEDRGWTKGWTPGRDAVHARTLAEATLFLARAAALATGEAGGPDEAWLEAVRSNAAFVTGVQRDDGALPAAWNATTGKPLAWAGTAGLAWVAALVEAGTLLRERRFLDAARRAGMHYADDVTHDRLAGAPEDVDLSPTSEDGYVALMAYVALADADEDDDLRRCRWIDLARHASDWTLSFRYAYDVAFDAGTDLGSIGYRSTGADMASPANEHLHTYGLVCLGELTRLSRLTGDGHYLARARESFANARQLIVRADGELGGRRGMMPERAHQTRYGGPKGSIGHLSHAWCLGLLLHACEVAATQPEVADA
jgi:hypothetical protein